MHKFNYKLDAICKKTILKYRQILGFSFHFFENVLSAMLLIFSMPCTVNGIILYGNHLHDKIKNHTFLLLMQWIFRQFSLLLVAFIVLSLQVKVFWSDYSSRDFRIQRYFYNYCCYLQASRVGQ